MGLGPTAERAVEEAWRSIAAYCVTTCGSRCCRHGKLVLTEREMTAMPCEARAALAGRATQNENGTSVLSLEPACPLLREGRCIAYAQRTRLCRDYPLLVAGDKVIVSDGCPAVREGMLKALFERLEEEGFTII